jgi:hypothetical protein
MFALLILLIYTCVMYHAEGLAILRCMSRSRQKD